MAVGSGGPVHGARRQAEVGRSRQFHITVVMGALENEALLEKRGAPPERRSTIPTAL